jgi:hypothetical protein
MTTKQASHFDTLIDKQIAGQDLTDIEHADYHRLCDQWEKENPVPQGMYPDFM